MAKKKKTGASRKRRKKSPNNRPMPLPLPESGPLAELRAHLYNKEPTPHALAILSDPAHQLNALPWGLREELAALWTPSKIGALATPALLALLAEHGVAVDQREFVKQAEGRDSAWEIAHQIWLPQARRHGDVPDNLLGLGAVELWKRWVPSRPSRDVLGSWVAEGCRLRDAGDRAAACEQWLQAWDVLRWRMGRRATLEAAGRLVDGGPGPELWLVALSCELCVLVAGDAEIGARAVAFHEDVLQRLQLATGDAWMHNRIRASLADVMFHLGRPREGEKMYRAIIGDSEAPTERMCLADALAYSADAATDEAIARAIEVLEPVPDYGVGLGPEAEARHRLAQLKTCPPLQPAVPVARLVDVGEHIPHPLSQRILAAGEAVVPDLIALVEQGVDAEDGSDEVWAACHALQLLGEMRATAAVEPMIRFLAGCDPWYSAGSWCIDALSQLGVGALEQVLEAHAATTDPDQRSALRHVLSSMGLRDERIFEILMQALDESPGEVALELWQYGDERAIPIVRRILEGVDDDEDARYLELALEEMEAMVEPEEDELFDRLVAGAGRP